MRQWVKVVGLSVFGFAMGACSGSETTAPEAPKVQEAAEVASKANVPTEADYKAHAEAVVGAIDAGADAAEILRLADQLTETGLGLIPGLIAAHPECTEYLQAIQAVGTTLKDLPLSEIEAGYHADGKLPTMPSTDCYHGKDLVVHPATVAALAKSGLPTEEDRAKAKGEIVEVLGHLGAIHPPK